MGADDTVSTILETLEADRLRAEHQTLRDELAVRYGKLRARDER